MSAAEKMIEVANADGIRLAATAAGTLKVTWDPLATTDLCEQNARARAHHGVLEAVARPASTKTVPKPVSPVTEARAKARLLRCCARTRSGSPCRRKPMGNGRCRCHGGCSTGPKTPAGLKRIAEAQRQRWARLRALST